MKHVFISYVHENERDVRRLCNALSEYGVEVWLDIEALYPGHDWSKSIRKAIQQGSFFLACFSKDYYDRDNPYMNEELTLAIEELRKRHRDRAWFIPIKLSECDIPDLDIGAGKTLRSIQWVDLYREWQGGVEKIVRAMDMEARPTKTDATEILVVRPILNDLEPPQARFEVLVHSLAFSLGNKVDDKRIIDLSGWEATRQGIEHHLAINLNLEHVLFLGRGSCQGNHVLGQGLEPCIDQGNIKLFKGKGLYFVCCNSAVALGKSAIENGARFFVGFARPTCAPYLMTRLAHHSISQCLLRGFTEIINGSDILDAWHEMLRYCKEAIISCVDKGTPDWLCAASVLDANLDSLKLLTPTGFEEGNGIIEEIIPKRMHQFSREQLDSGLNAVGKWMLETTDPYSEIVASASPEHALSPRRIYETLQYRVLSGSLGYDDIPERFLALMINAI